jgi:hypothetical protein
MSLIQFPLDDIAGTGIVREKDFRAKLDGVDWEIYRNKAVLIPWIHHLELPIWAYLMTTARLSEVVAVLSFGESCCPTVLLQRHHLE